MTEPNLSRFEVRQSDDLVVRDHDLVCVSCGRLLCTVEPGDTLEVLVGVATDHNCADKEDEEDES